MDLLDPDEAFDDDYLWFYDLELTPERNRAEADEIIVTLGLSPDDRVLDAPCGHGRIAIPLASDGMAVIGVDRSEAFLDRAAVDADLAGVSLDLRPGDLRELPIDEASVDAALCWFTSFGYFDDDGNRRALDEFARVLRPGGQLLIETMHPYGLATWLGAEPTVFVTERGDDEMVGRMRFEPTTGVLRIDRTIRRGDRRRSIGIGIRLPTPTELAVWLAASGFSAWEFASRDHQPLTPASRRMVVVATR